jgi:hypothetical protein
MPPRGNVSASDKPKPKKLQPKKSPPTVMGGLGYNVGPVPKRQRQTAPIYAKVWKALGLPGKPPPVYSDPNMSPSSAGQQPWANRDVLLQPEVVRGIKTLPFDAAREPAALDVLTHEYAHTAQPRVMKKQYAEGGAASFAARMYPEVLRALGISGERVPVGEFLPGIMYPEFIRAINRLRNPDQFIFRGQFGRR